MNGLLFFEIHGQSKLPSDKYPKPDIFLSDLLLTLEIENATFFIFL